MSIGIAELIVQSNEASQIVVNLKSKQAQARKMLKDVRDEAAALETKFAAAVSAVNALPEDTAEQRQLKTEAATKAAALRAERQTLQAAVESDLTALGITF